MRTNLTLEDIKKIVETIYNGNLAKHRTSKGSVPYENENSETIILYDENGKNLGEKDLAKYLNLHFYTWRNRVVDSEPNKQMPFDAWVESIEGSLNDAYALVELTNDNSVASQDIDSAQKIGRVTIIIQANKVANLDYYASKIHNKLLGEPQDITNAYGDELKAYINMGILLYDEEPSTMQLGECVVVSFNFTINYLNSAYSYMDMDMQFAFGGDPDELEENTENIQYHKIPLTEATIEKSFASNAVPYSNRPDLTGVINSATTNDIALSFYDFKQPFMDLINKYFWKLGAIKIKETNTWETADITNMNVPVFMKVKVPYASGDITYKYRYVISSIRKSIKNGDFNVCALSLKVRSLAREG